MTTYDHRAIEAKWRAYWDASKTFQTPNPGDPGFDPAKPKYYVVDFFPYPSGKGLHVGHPLGYIATDIVARHKRMTGHNVLHPMGFDAFGLPAEQYAVETGTHPRATTDQNIATMRRQLKDCGLSIDWSREVSTTDVGYYRWTQWIFLQLFHSWFDPAVHRARPIAELVARLEADEVRIGDRGVVATVDAELSDAPAWSTLDARGRDAALATVRLAYADEIPVNWCPALGTVLANEEVTNDGRSERGNHPVFRRPLEQWMLRITAYADRLLQDLDLIDWPESIKLMQRNWIGRSTGARVRFEVVGHDAEIEVFTTRPDTLFGATYMVLAPEHPLVEAITTLPRRAAVDAYRAAAMRRTEIDRQADSREKTGVPTGATAINPVNGQEIPVWIADYVLMGYGTGAIMAVPGHDARDFAFARTFDLPVVPVVLPPDEWLQERASALSLDGSDVIVIRQRYLADPTLLAEVFAGDGVAVNSASERVSLDGTSTAEAKAHIVAWLEAAGLGRGEVQYKLRDWLFSRQRYWGEPFPILHDAEGVVHGVPDDRLPVELPDLDDFRPVASDDVDAPPEPSLGRADASWKVVEIDGVRYRRELNTMPQWAGSCWYYLRYLDPTNQERFVDPEVERYWMQPNGVDLYMGGAEMAVLHLLYARFWHKVLFDLGHVSTVEPFGRLFNQGYIQAYSYQDPRGIYVDADRVEEGAPGTFTFEGEPVSRFLGKMGKSLKNSVSPDEILEEYGCDTLRLYEMYLGPLEASKPWNTRAIVGSYRFVARLWRNLIDEDTGSLRVTDEPPSDDLLRLTHKTISGVSDNMDGLRFNSAIARLIELNNALTSLDAVPRAVAEPLVLMLAPIAPHVCEELWSRLGHADSLAYAPWPTHDPALLASDTMDIVVQVMGKKRGLVHVPIDADQDEILSAAHQEESVARHLAGKTIRKVIYVPGKLLNVVAS